MEFQAFPSLFDQPDFGKSLPIQIAEYIAKEIFVGNLTTGERLKEEELAAHFHTSRAPVREALYLLQIEGLVERLPRRGTVVKEYTEKELHELYDVRLSLECTAIEKLEPFWDEEMAMQFGDVLERMRCAVEDADARTYARLNDAFHQLFVQSTGNKMLWRIYHQLNNLLVILLQVSTQEIVQMQTSYDEHAAIVQALKQRNFTLAKERLAAHVHHGMTRALQTRR